MNAHAQRLFDSTAGAFPMVPPTATVILPGASQRRLNRLCQISKASKQQTGDVEVSLCSQEYMVANICVKCQNYAVRNTQNSQIQWHTVLPKNNICKNSWKIQYVQQNAHTKTCKKKLRDGRSKNHDATYVRKQWSENERTCKEAS